MRALPLERVSSDALSRRELLGDHLVLLAAITASRWVFRSHDLYLMDSVNFALGMQHFSPALYQPHPPGYYLYVKLAQLVQGLLADPNDALVAISILASGIAAALIYQLAHAWFGRAAARWAGMLFVFSPLAWFHGTVALIYIVEAAMAALIGYLNWLVWRGRHWMLIPAAIAFGLAAGIRQSTALFLAPLLLISLWQAGWRIALLALGAGALTVFAWFFPMLAESGGHDAYFTALSELWNRIPASQSVFRQPGMILPHLLFLVAAYGLCFASAAPLLFMRGLKASSYSDMPLFLAAWLAPGLLFFVFMFFHPLALGYALFLFVPLFSIIGAKTAAWFEAPGASSATKMAIILGGAAFNLAIYLWAPLYASNASVQHSETELSRMQNDIRTLAAPADTVLVSFDWHLYGFRHVGYHLPDYLVLQYPETRATNHYSVAVMHDGQTQALTRLKLDQYRRFLVVDAARNLQFRDRLIAEFPAGTITRIRIGNHEYLSGPIAYLSRLFPFTSSDARRDGSAP